MQSANKMCVALLFGGMSSEHEVSCVSVGNFVATSIVPNTRCSRWASPRRAAGFTPRPRREQMADGSWEEMAGNMPCVISPDRSDHGMILFTPEGRVEKMHVDVGDPGAARPVGRGRHGAGPAGAGRHRLCGLRRAGKCSVHGQGCGQRPVRCQQHPAHQVGSRQSLGDRE